MLNQLIVVECDAWNVIELSHSFDLLVSAATWKKGYQCIADFEGMVCWFYCFAQFPNSWRLVQLSSGLMNASNHANGFVACMLHSVLHWSQDRVAFDTYWLISLRPLQPNNMLLCLRHGYTCVYTVLLHAVNFTVAFLNSPLQYLIYTYSYFIKSWFNGCVRKPVQELLGPLVLSVFSTIVVCV
jgi:hypothetical protein